MAEALAPGVDELEQVTVGIVGPADGFRRVEGPCGFGEAVEGVVALAEGLVEGVGGGERVAHGIELDRTALAEGVDLGDDAPGGIALAVALVAHGGGLADGEVARVIGGDGTEGQAVGVAGWFRRACSSGYNGIRCGAEGVGFAEYGCRCGRSWPG